MLATSEILNCAKKVSRNRPLSTDKKNEAINKMAEFLIEDTDLILKANSIDIENAKGKISDVMIDRLLLSEERIKAMADGMKKVCELNDPVGRVLQSSKHNNGLVIEKTSVPFGVVSIIYESRPNVTSDAAVLSFKSGNVCVLRSGKDAFYSAQAIVNALKKGLEECGIDKNYINLIEDTSRNSANELMTAVGLVDLLIPRGGKGLIKACTENAKVPCIETGTGICHIYVDKDADISMALDIVDNAKRSRPSVCNAAECCIVHKSVANEFLPKLYERFTNYSNKANVELFGDDYACSIIDIAKSCDDDYDTEFLDYKMSIKTVESVEEAIQHISLYSTHHSESIITGNNDTADIFVSSIDSAAVYVNASTRFTDGGEFGLGCEMGISTQKLHARGPMGLNELNTYKYVIKGNGQVR